MGALGRIGRQRVQNGSDLSFRSGGFRNQQVQCLGGVFQKSVTKRPLAIDKSADGALVYAKAPREGSRSAKQLNAISEVFTSLVD